MHPSWQQVPDDAIHRPDMDRFWIAAAASHQNDRPKLRDMEWRKYITSDPKVLAGKPAVKGTRLSVEFILGLMAKGWYEASLLENYERLEPTHIKAVYAFSAAMN